MSYLLKPSGDVKKLPKWAQEYIATLRSEIERQDRHIKSISSEHPSSNVVLKGHARPDVTLAPDSGVYFFLGDNRDTLRGSTIEVRHDPSRQFLDVRSYGMGQLLITPWSGNAIRMKVGPR